jgi:glycosyltransferase involved in cell wall biosynthesis
LPQHRGVNFLQYSLVVATLNDSGDLPRLLHSFSDLEAGPVFEVIIVDQNGDDRLVGLVARFSEKLEIVHLRVPFRGANRARNLGAQMARGNWLAFPDDDCELLPDTLLEVECARVDPNVYVVTGQTVDEKGDPNVLRWKRQPMEFTRWTMFGCLTESTLFVEKGSFLAAGGFDEQFGPGAIYPAAEGIDLMNRLFAVRTEGKAWYTPRVKLKHPTKIPPWDRSAVGRFFSYARGDGALIAKNPQPHMLCWGFRTLATALIQALSFRGWRSVAYGARFIGLIKGYFCFRMSSWRA